MSVAEMKIVGVIGPKNLLNKVLCRVILQGSMHMIDAFSRVYSADFFLPPTEKNIEVLEDEPNLKPYLTRKDFTEEERIIKLFQNLFDIKPYLKKEYLSEDYDYEQFMEQFFGIYKELYQTEQEINSKLTEINKKKEFINNLKYLSLFNLEINRYINMEYLVLRLIKMSKENYDKLKRNYMNIPAIVLKVAVEGKDVILVSIAPETLEETLERIYSSLNYTILPIPQDMTGTVEQVSNKLAESIEQDQKTIESLKKSIVDYKEQYQHELVRMYARLEMQKKIEEVKSKIAIGKRTFFMFGFVPTDDINRLKEDLERKFDNELIIIIDEVKKNSSRINQPPTKLSNLPLFKPFESLVKMYGIPSYREKDPTVFFALTYLLIFGAMFGDVGQGFVLLLGGLILEYIYHKIELGTILNRLGLSSVVFGFVYGSVFGSEEILPALLIRPMANINNMLIIAVGFGIVFILLSYIFGILNAKKENNLKEGLFGENGLTGFLFYILLLYTIFRVFILHKKLLPVISIFLLLFIMVILFKDTLSSLFFKEGSDSKKLSVNDYIEEGFGLIEMLLSMLSNTISFLRVGAFALNHVGLYIAFLTLANMMSSAWGNWTVLVVGNIVILTLEALIVFIQALRLEYYELFTKYYRGDGIEYNPAKIDTINTYFSQKARKRFIFKKMVSSSVISDSSVYSFFETKMEV